MRAAVRRLLAEVESAGMVFRLDGERLRMQARVAPPAELLARLKAHKAELTTIVACRRCRYCDQRIDWTMPGAIASADRTGAHVACYEHAVVERHVARLLAAGERAVTSPDALDDEAELMLRGEIK